MKCENCSHAEMCKWIDELEGRGCDFCDEKPCELLILKSDIFLHQNDRKKWVEIIEREREKGLIILPPYFTPLLIPNDVEIRIEQEPCETSTDEPMTMVYPTIFCEDAISREAAIDIFGDVHPLDHNTNAYIEKIKELPSVTPSRRKGLWIDREEYDVDRWKCSECGRTEQWRENFCPKCGAVMVKESSDDSN